MKKKILIGMVILVGIILLATRLGHHRMGKAPEVSSPENQGPPESAKISYYTCAMHHQIHEDHPGACPICGMKLVPVYEDGGQPSSQEENPGIIISPERQQLIGVKPEVALKKPVVKEIRTVGRIAFDPELAVAEQEFVEIAKNVPSLRAAARSHLRILGMSEEEIQELAKKGKVSSDLYLPGADDSVWVYATLYQAEMELVKPGMEAEVSLSSGDTTTPLTGTVRSVDPIVDPMTRSVRARIEITKAGGKLRPNSFVNVLLKVDLGEALVIPRSAVIDTGMRHVAFVVQGDQNFQSRDLRLGAEVGNEVVVLEGISEGEKVATGATFLVDSESRLKAAVLAPTAAPQCPEGEAWDVGMAMCMPKVGK